MDDLFGLPDDVNCPRAQAEPALPWPSGTRQASIVDEVRVDVDDGDVLGNSEHCALYAL